MSERRYSGDEIARIFEAALAPVPTPRESSAADGLTLQKLQEIGREVGIAPSRVAGAAAALDGGRSLRPRRTALGMPIGVGRTAELPRGLTDREWALLLAELRDTFGVAGRDRSTGEVRHWTNSNLHVVVEPTLEGWRLRMGTVKGDAVATNSIGVAGVVLGIATSASLLLSGEPVTAGMMLLGGLGGGAFLFNALRLPRWAQRREAQMQHLIERTRLIMGTTGEGPGTDG